MMKLKSLYLGGFKSFALAAPGAAENTLRLADVTVLLGANGAGKSNLVSFFKMLGYLAEGELQRYVGEAGTAETLLHYGSATTAQIDATLVFVGDDEAASYKCALTAAQPDTLVLATEAVTWQRLGEARSHDRALGSGHRESLLRRSAAQAGEQEYGAMLDLLRGCKVYQFHDTSDDAKIRKSGYVEDAAYLRGDGGNLAAYLYALKQTQAPYYDRIVRTIRQVCPQFGDFVLAPSPRNDKYILLNWREAYGPDYLMGPHQLSDGTLRFMALATLLLQPPERLPSVIVLDEPELGLHPSAIAVLADLVRGVTAHSQVILATQSPTLVNHFSLEQIRPIEFRQGRSVLLELDAAQYESWLEDYTTGELWQKDVFGGGPRYA